MKVAVVLLAVAVIGAFAQDTTTASGPPPFKCDGNAFVCKLKEWGHHIKYHASKLGNKLKDVGMSVLNSAVSQGSSLLANGANAVLGTVVEHLNKEGLVGKRDMSSFFSKVKDHFSNGMALMKQFKAGLHAAFERAVNKLTGQAAKTGALEKVEQDTDKKVDDAVAEYEKENKKGFFGMASAIAGKIRSFMKAGMDRLRQAYQKKMQTRAIIGFDFLKDAWNKAKSHLSNIAGSIADTFKPHVESLKNGIASLGAKVKEHAGNLLTAAKGTFNDLKTKLAGHIDTLKGHAAKLGTHAVNAFNALKQAVGDIAVQAVNNAKDSVSGIVKTGKDAAGVIAGHVSGALSGN